MPARLGEPKANAGLFQRPKEVKRVASNGYEPPFDEVANAIRVVARKKDWERLRVAVWTRWLELVTEQQPVGYVNTEIRRQAWLANEADPGRSEPRHIGAIWAPASARIHDGLVGQVLASKWCCPEGYIGKFDARPRIVQLAREGLLEVKQFRKANPKAAKSIAGPLGHYCNLLREARDHPESRLIVRS